MNRLYIFPPDLGCNARRKACRAALLHGTLCNDAVRPKLASQMCMLFLNKPLLATRGVAAELVMAAFAAFLHRIHTGTNGCHVSIA